MPPKIHHGSPPIMLDQTKMHPDLQTEVLNQTQDQPEVHPDPLLVVFAQIQN